MKKTLILSFLLTAVVLTLTACGTPKADYDLEFIKDNYSSHQLDFTRKNMKTPLDICGILTHTGMYADVKTIYFNNNWMTSAKVDLSCLTWLEKVSFAFNDINSLKWLTLPKSCKEIDMSNNKIKKIDNKDSLLNTEYLNFGFNQITSVDSLKSLTQLKQLEIYHNEITDISSLKNLINLDTIKLEFNNISDVSVLKNFPNLKRATIKNNPIDKDIIDEYTTMTQKSL